MAISFNICLADQVIAITALYDSTRFFCRKYLTDALPAFHITIDSSDIVYERNKSDQEALSAGQIPITYSDEYLETLALYRKIVTELLNYDILLFHGSAISVDNEAYIFTAKSGTGKSTHTQLWKKHFGDRATIINDDKPLLRISNEEVIVYGTPWDGKHHRSLNTSCHVKSICLLTRSQTNYIEPLTKKQALPMLCQQTYRPAVPLALSKTLSLINRLGNVVEFYKLECNMEPDAALTAYHGMNK